MDIDKLVKKYKNKLKDYKIPCTDYTQTVTCSLHGMMYSNIFANNPSYVNNNSLRWDYNTDRSRPVNISIAIHNTVEWISDFKVHTSLFNNYLWSRLCEEDQPVPEINDVFFTRLFKTVYGQDTIYKSIYDDYKQIYNIGNFPMMSRISQVISYLKNELTTVCKNNIKLNFKNRVLSIISWRILDLLDTIEIDKKKKWKLYLGELVIHVFECITTNSTINIKDINKKYGINLKNKTLNKQFKGDTKLFNTLLLINKDSRSQKRAKAKDNVEPNTNRMKFTDAVNSNPQYFTKYLYYAETIIDTLNITKKYNNITLYVQNNIYNRKDITEEEKKKLRKEYYKRNWKWTKNKLPKCKLMIINETKKHFIRIDKKVLK